MTAYKKLYNLIKIIMTQLNKHFDDIFYYYDKISYRKKIRELEDKWYIWQAIAEAEFKTAFRLFIISIADYLKSVIVWLRFILSPKK